MGSSARMRRARCTRARAMATRCCCPPESVLALCQAMPSMPTLLSACQASAFSAWVKRPTRLRQLGMRGSWPMRTLVITVRRPTRLNCWKMKPDLGAQVADVARHAAARLHLVRAHAHASRARIAADEAGDVAKQRGLAGARGPDEGDHLAGLQLELHARERLLRPPEGLAQAIHGQRHAARHRICTPPVLFRRLTHACHRRRLCFVCCRLLTIYKPGRSNVKHGAGKNVAATP